ncbi:acVLRF1 family peptidyl-tRNA hydrolase [Amycolatopsis sp. H20-H5]|uniref:acVLRF1 family peptidyl-tRNA hydrolase n=1 Tax=Amycolatopsis sp. H20-H5 TaxID=3046309 RepID=UPI002DB5A679|nr:acVLRF1 family peptidyl-tRNA hydrolase [Amycolatopsis sp. H20-H5]MEC3976628.1 acVLRF1 family peptidyl-tRNA hydrolase [Amycolatopsis sp. H20-H5]
MAKPRQVAGGGHAVEVTPDRLAGWFDRFSVRNDGVRSTEIAPHEVTVTAANGTVAVALVPFGPLTELGTHEGLAVGPLVEHVLVPRRVALLLVRLGGHSVGIARGAEVVLSRTDRHLVHGRSAAGGWSQHRFARRREGQVRQALRAAADDAFEVLVPRLSEVDAVVLGGDRRALDELRADRRLAPLFALAEPRVLDIVEPRRTVLDDAAERAVSVEIRLRDA